MEINETTSPIEIDWEGELVPLSGMFAPGGSELPKVSLGKPFWWGDQKIFGDGWTPPAGGKRYGLARFAFSLRPQLGQIVRHAEFTVYLQPVDGTQLPIVFDLFPKSVTEEQSGDLKASIGPEFKFSGAEASVAKLETTVHLREITSVISADGIGESTARWVFTARRSHLLIGSQLVYAIVELPNDGTKYHATVQLSAEVTTSFGPVRGLLPKTEQTKFRYLLTKTQQ